MELDKYKNHKFNFFKVPNSVISHKFTLSDTVIPVVFMTTWVILGFFYRSDMRQQNISLPVAGVVAQDLTQLMNQKLEFLEELKQIDFKNLSKTLINKELKRLNYTLYFNNTDEQYAIIALPNKSDDFESIKYSYANNKIAVIWRDVPAHSNDFKMFKEVWNSKVYPTQVTKTVEGGYDIKITQNIPPMYRNTILESNKKLEKSIDKIPVNNPSSKAIVDKAIADNPYLKPQEKKIQNYVDGLLKMQSDMKKEK